MDRLSLVAALLAAPCLGACDDGAPSAAPPGRVVAVEAEATEDPADRFCDVQPAGAPALTLPALAGGEAPAGGRRWLNVWATWCRPCVEEMPLLDSWRDRLAADGVEVELTFLSADADAEAVARFREAHPEVPETLRMADPDALPAWATQVGLDEGATLPMHLLTDAQGRVRCARTGAVAEEHYAAVRAILSR